jgi:hypothetical protein
MHIIRIAAAFKFNLPSETSTSESATLTAGQRESRLLAMPFAGGAKAALGTVSFDKRY